MATTANSTVKLTKYQNLQKTIASAEEKFILKGVLRCVTVIGLFHLLHTFFYSVVYLTTGPKPLPKRFLHIVRSKASFFK